MEKILVNFDLPQIKPDLSFSIKHLRLKTFQIVQK